MLYFFLEKCGFFNVQPAECASTSNVFYHRTFAGESVCWMMKFMGCMGVENKFETKDKCEEKCIVNDAAVPGNQGIKIPITKYTPYRKSLIDPAS